MREREREKRVNEQSGYGMKLIYTHFTNNVQFYAQCQSILLLCKQNGKVMRKFMCCQSALLLFICICLSFMFRLTFCSFPKKNDTSWHFAIFHHISLFSHSFSLSLSLSFFFFSYIHFVIIFATCKIYAHFYTLNVEQHTFYMECFFRIYNKYDIFSSGKN